MGYVERNIIGLEKKPAVKVVSDLNKLLANYQVFQMNVRGFHWNLKGDFFFEMHAQFGQLYDDLNLKIDEIAERVAAFGEVPFHTFSAYLEESEIEVSENVTDAKEGADLIADALKLILNKQRRIADGAREMGDEGTYEMMTGYIKEQEKMLWMYSSFLAK